jgi:hypothetical protein
MKWRSLTLGTVLGTLLAAGTVLANYDGGIWTTLGDGTEVNQNLYPSKESVYLNGGPGKGGGTNANALPDGIYVFMVTDPSGAELLSTDNAECRQVEVVGGVFDNVDAAGGCGHALGASQVGFPVQLMPYNDTPNNGGEYKVWLTPLGSYQCPLDVVSCDEGKFGFIDGESKTDNFKVGSTIPDEIDTRFHDTYYGGPLIDGLSIRWGDTHGASNTKFSYYEPEHIIMHEAHVEAPEIGTHYITINNQQGCTVGDVYVAGTKQRKRGPQTVGIKVTQAMKKKGSFTIFVDVVCTGR